jgi:hypothetical protein
MHTVASWRELVKLAADYQQLLALGLFPGAITVLKRSLLPTKPNRCSTAMRSALQRLSLAIRMRWRGCASLGPGETLRRTGHCRPFQQEDTLLKTQCAALHRSDA